MLVAEYQGQRIEARRAPRGLAYICPQCRGALTYKSGRRVVSHFAHKPPTDCSWAAGETRAHLDAKQLVHDAMVARGYTAAIEHVIDTLPGDRRADVMVWSPTGDCLAIELQHTSIGLDTLEARAFAYARINVSQIWIPFLSRAALAKAEPRGIGLFLEKYSARPFERWVHGFGGGDGMWMYAPTERCFRHARLARHQIYVPASSWFAAGGEEQSAGGYYRHSKRWRELTLSASHSIDGLQVTTRPREKASLAVYNWPDCRVGSFQIV